ncbi:hypothetical protein [Pseudoalteromonas viridis]|uniref:Uncharacterized protein n=1 Tax=Pseudoalteromonas viridis TaxID=339617 RepID=A0ABX7V3A7_9GAMM|nr:hypothetical protein [Pseudoalteromonas viridis]QTL34930.1 hypothetical protein J5X90_15560 [Pseudoalteromonas viridis]
MKTRVLFTILALLMACVCIAKRASPSDIGPLIAGDYVYTVPHWSSENGTGQNGGYIQILDAKTGVEAWGVQVYKTNYKRDLERDVQDIFITGIEINIWNTVLTVKDELGRRYEIDLKSRKVQAID